MSDKKVQDVGYFLVLFNIYWRSNKGKWRVVDVESMELMRDDSDVIFSPLTLVYFYMTGEEIHRGSFWCEEMTQRFGMPWWDVLKITYAQIGCQGHDRNLREDLLNVISGWCKP